MSPAGKCGVLRRNELHGEQLYASRREKEWKQQQFTKQVSQLHTQTTRRHWEDQSDLKRLDADGRQRDRNNSGLREDMLNARRCLLREKLEREDAELYTQLWRPEQTLDERREVMRAQLATLRAEREAERKEFADKMYDYRFRLDCDELRCAVSHQHAQETRRDRDAQLQERAHLKQEQQEQEALHHQLMTEDVRAFGEERAALEADRKQTETMRMSLLDKQCEYRQRRCREQAKLEACDAAELNERLAQMRADEASEERERKVRERRCREHLLADMAERRLRAEEERRHDLEVERELCQRDRDEAARQTAALASERAAHARGMDEYRVYLRQARMDEVAAERELERLVADEAETVYRRQRELWLAEQQRRQCLLQEVIDIRRKQVHDQLERGRRERADDRAYHAQLRAELERLERLELERQERLRQAEREHAADLQAQAEYRRRQDEEMKQEDIRQAEVGKRTEHEYQDKLDQCLREKLCERPHPWRAMHKYFDVAAAE